MRLAVSAALLLLLFPQDPPDNLGFEHGLDGWGGAGEGYTRDLSDIAHKGKKSARISGSGEFGTLTRTIDAAPYRGGRILLRGWIRADKVEGGAGLWMRVDGDEQILAFDNMSDRSVQGTRDWTKATIVLPVPKEAKSVVFGAMLVGKGTAWFDDFEIKKLDSIDPDPRPLTDRAKKNLEVLAKSWGVARYFHPGSTDDLELWLLRKIPDIEAAKNDEALADQLNHVLWGLGRVDPTRDRKLKTPVAHKKEKGVILDFRGVTHGVDPTETVAAVIGKPLDIPDARSSKYLGYPGGRGSIYHRSFTSLPGRRIEPKGENTSLVVVVDSETSPTMARWLAALRAAGAKIVGSRLPAWAGDLYATEAFPGWTLTVPLAALSDRWVEPDFPGGIEEAAKLLDGKELQGEGEVVVSVPDFFPSPEMRQVRLASVIILWNVLHYFYPYWDVVKADWDGALREHLTLASVAKTPGDLRRVLARMLAKAKDGHGSVHVTGGEPQEWTPPILVERIEGKWIVTRSEAKEVSVGAELTGFDARAEELALEASAATSQWRDLRISLELLAGPKGSDAKLTLDGKEATLKRTVFAWNLREKRPASKELEGGFGYISLDGTTAKQIADAMKKFADAPGIVFDLRGYPASDFQEIGWLAEQPAKSQHMDIPIVTRPDKAPEWQKGGWSVAPRKPRYTGKVVFVTDGSAISAAETYMAIIRFNKIAPIVGEPTAGTNGNVTFIRMPGGISVTFTGMRVTNIDGSTHHGAGVPPDVVVHRTVKGVREGRDELLEAAVRKLKEK